MPKKTRKNAVRKKLTAPEWQNLLKAARLQNRAKHDELRELIRAERARGDHWQEAFQDTAERVAAKVEAVLAKYTELAWSRTQPAPGSVEAFLKDSEEQEESVERLSPMVRASLLREGRGIGRAEAVEYLRQAGFKKAAKALEHATESTE